MAVGANPRGKPLALATLSSSRILFSHPTVGTPFRHWSPAAGPCFKHSEHGYPTAAKLHTRLPLQHLKHRSLGGFVRAWPGAFHHDVSRFRSDSLLSFFLLLAGVGTCTSGTTGRGRLGSAMPGTSVAPLAGGGATGGGPSIPPIATSPPSSSDVSL